VAFGPFELGALDDAAVEEVKTEELRKLLAPEIVAQAKADFEAPLIEHDARALPPRHSGARPQGREPGIQKQSPSTHLDSESPLRGSRNEKKKPPRRDRSGGPRPKYPRPRE
ncbi:MAG: hypothetical protein ACREB8_15490, partial [Pseudolabrys sp.]